jgi:2-polyprenyl-6-hydroxyphenyl methylase/3-demethylubiquinone-9 3-methyltransferase
MSATRTTATTTLDPAEVEKFAKLAAEWWNPKGKMAVLHKFNPVRLGHIRDTAVAHFGRDPRAPKPLADLRILDIGCGGGLLCEPLARMGATVVGIDPARTNVETARLHAGQSGVPVDYRCTTAEELVAAGEAFDIVLAMEVVEHVADIGLFVGACTSLVRPGGLLVMATINRTMKSYALAIVGAEYVLRWLPRGTHDWNKFVTPDELAGAIEDGDLEVFDRKGVWYNLLRDRWEETVDLDVNYMVTARRPA